MYGLAVGWIDEMSKGLGGWIARIAHVQFWARLAAGSRDSTRFDKTEDQRWGIDLA